MPGLISPSTGSDARKECKPANLDGAGEVLSSSSDDDLQMDHPSKVMQQFVKEVAAEAAVKKECGARFVKALADFKQNFATECGGLSAKQKKLAIKHIQELFHKEFANSIH